MSKEAGEVEQREKIWPSMYVVDKYGRHDWISNEL
jgi:hypothetical protein